MTDSELDKLLYAGMSPEHIAAEKAYWKAASDFGLAQMRLITLICVPPACRFIAFPRSAGA